MKERGGGSDTYKGGRTMRSRKGQNWKPQGSKRTGKLSKTPGTKSEKMKGIMLLILKSNEED